MGEMDSGNNSGSIQSSSGGGGDEHELDSTLYNSSSMATFDNTMPFQLYSFNNGSSNTFYPTFSQSSPCSNFVINPNNTITTNTSNNDNTSISDLGMVWPNKYTSSFDNNPTKCNTMGLVGPPTLPLPSSRAPPASNESSDQPVPGGGGRNPKKRSRASRRAPTTVLTTDTNNFRQMVQEFTGIPAQPFSGRTRLDLFGGLGMQLPRNGSLFETPPYLLRPFPQKVVPQHNNPSMNNVPNVVQQSTKSSNPQGLISTATASTSIRPNATGSLMNEFALGHFTTITTTTPAAATIGCSNMGMNNVHSHQDHFPVQRQGNCSVDDGGNYNGSNANASASSGNHGGGTRSEGMVDSWICSSE